MNIQFMHQINNDLSIIYAEHIISLVMLRMEVSLSVNGGYHYTQQYILSWYIRHYVWGTKLNYKLDVQENVIKPGYSSSYYRWD